MPKAMSSVVTEMMCHSPAIAYPESFSSRVVAEYGDDVKVLRALKTGDYVLGKFLMERMDLDICPEQIVTAMEAGRSEDVLDEARAAVRRTSIYLEWTRIIVHHVQSIGSKRTLRPVR